MVSQGKNSKVTASEKDFPRVDFECRGWKTNNRGLTRTRRVERKKEASGS